jgi:hypothetical protein
VNADETRCQKDQHTASQNKFFQDLKNDASRKVREVKFWAELIALIALIAYTCETHRTNNLTQKALDNSGQQFQTSETRAKTEFGIDQRPYVWVASIVGSIPTKNKQLLANITLNNYGKTPAMQERNTGKIFYGENVAIQADKWFEDIDQGRLSTKDTSVTIVPQGVPPEKSLVWTSIGTDNVLSEADVKYVLHTNFSEILALHVEYTDISGKPLYFSDICYHRTANGHMGICHKHNEIK